MRFLTDENIRNEIVDWVRAQGHDVVRAVDVAPGAADGQWLQFGEAGGYVVITADKDFGELVFRDGLNSHGVILLRFHNMPERDHLSRFQAVWGVVEANPAGRFIVVTKKRVRVRPIR